PSAARAAAALEPGATTEPIRTASGIRLVTLVERVVAPDASYEAVRDRVLAEWRRRRDERALTDALARLRGAARVEISADVVTK
ncbi:MAG: peptidylprolyl isomerase, partial [Candidatus Binatia bacterium]